MYIKVLRGLRSLAVYVLKSMSDKVASSGKSTKQSNYNLYQKIIYFIFKNVIF